MFLDVARSRSDARPNFRSGRAKRASWEAIPRRGVTGRRPRNVKENPMWINVQLLFPFPFRN
eukprot:6930875-Pyramimonas_sp.AAC.1